MASGGPAVAGESLGIRPMLRESCQRDVVIRAGDTSEAAPGSDRQIRQAPRMLRRWLAQRQREAGEAEAAGGAEDDATTRARRFI